MTSCRLWWTLTKSTSPRPRWGAWETSTSVTPSSTPSLYDRNPLLLQGSVPGWSTSFFSTRCTHRNRLSSIFTVIQARPVCDDFQYTVMCSCGWFVFILFPQIFLLRVDLRKYKFFYVIYTLCAWYFMWSKCFSDKFFFWFDVFNWCYGLVWNNDMVIFYIHLFLHIFCLLCSFFVGIPSK